jgi:hypothetical protein
LYYNIVRRFYVWSRGLRFCVGCRGLMSVVSWSKILCGVYVLNKDLDILYRWLQANRLSLNVLKSEYMLIGSKVRINKLTSDPKIVIGGHRLKRV